MWFIGVEVEEETSAPPPKKILGRLSFQSKVTGKTWERSAFDRAGFNGWNSPRIHTWPCSI